MESKSSGSTDTQEIVGIATFEEKIDEAEPMEVNENSAISNIIFDSENMIIGNVALEIEVETSEVSMETGNTKQLSLEPLNFAEQRGNGFQDDEVNKSESLFGGYIKTGDEPQLSKKPINPWIEIVEEAKKGPPKSCLPTRQEAELLLSLSQPTSSTSISKNGVPPSTSKKTMVGNKKNAKKGRGRPLKRVYGGPAKKPEDKRRGPRKRSSFKHSSPFGIHVRVLPRICHVLRKRTKKGAADTSSLGASQPNQLEVVFTSKEEFIPHEGAGKSILVPPVDTSSALKIGQHQAIYCALNPNFCAPTNPPAAHGTELMLAPAEEPMDSTAILTNDALPSTSEDFNFQGALVNPSMEPAIKEKRGRGRPPKPKPVKQIKKSAESDKKLVGQSKKVIPILDELEFSGPTSDGIAMEDSTNTSLVTPIHLSSVFEIAQSQGEYGSNDEISKSTLMPTNEVTTSEPACSLTSPTKSKTDEPKKSRGRPKKQKRGKHLNTPTPEPAPPRPVDVVSYDPTKRRRGRPRKIVADVGSLNAQPLQEIPDILEPVQHKFSMEEEAAVVLDGLVEVEPQNDFVSLAASIGSSIRGASESSMDESDDKPSSSQIWINNLSNVEPFN